MEYYGYQDGLIHRYLSQNGAWDSHVRKCRGYILKAIERLAPEKVTILGSGWLIEVPLLEISEKVKEVTLVDIIHPKAVIEQTSKINNVRLIETDITGGIIDDLWNKTNSLFPFRKRIDINSIDFPEFKPDNDPGLLISLNLLSQLDSLPVRLIKKRAPVSENDLHTFRKKIQENHISFLKKYPSVLISDLCEIYTDKNGVATVEKTVLADIPDGKLPEQWIWDFDLTGTDYNMKKSVLEVHAIIL